MLSLAHRLPFGLRHLLPLTRQSRELRAMEQQVAEATAALRKRLPRQVVEELAIPSYTHPNWLMRYLVWERLAVALEWLDALSMKPSTVMDFGCGIGILFPSLTRRGAHVLACDIHPEVAAMGAGLLGALRPCAQDRLT